MKGVKTMSLANATSKRFQSDDIITQRVHLPGGEELVATLAQMKAENKKLTATVTELTGKVKELQDKYDALDVE